MDFRCLCVLSVVSLGLVLGADVQPITTSNLTKSPPSKSGQNFTVTLEFSLRRIYELNHAQEFVDLDGWLHLYWVDKDLSWDTSGKRKSEFTRISTGEIWVPEIILYNDFSERHNEAQKNDLAAVYNTGHVQWVPARRFRAYCQVNLRNFPFDQQSCSLIFGVWAYGVDEVDLAGIESENTSPVDLQHFIPGGEWDIVTSHFERRVKDYGIGSAPKAELVYTLSFQRATEFYFNIFVVPAILVTFLVPFQFLLHQDARERVTFCLILMLSIILLTMSLSTYISKGMRYVPRLVEFYIVSIGIITVSFLFSIFILHFYHRGGRKGRLPGFIRTIFLSGLNRLFFIDTPLDFEETTPKQDEPIELETVKTEEPKKVEEAKPETKDPEKEEKAEEDTEEKEKAVDEEAPAEPKEEPKPAPVVEDKPKPKPVECPSKYQELADLLRESLRMKNAERIGDLIRDEWRLLSLMFDRVFFIGFMVIFVIYANAILN